MIVLEGKLTLGYLCRMNTCLFVSDVSLNPLGLFMNKHTYIIVNLTFVQHSLKKKSFLPLKCLWRMSLIPVCKCELYVAHVGRMVEQAILTSVFCLNNHKDRNMGAYTVSHG